MMGHTKTDLEMLLRMDFRTFFIKSFYSLNPGVVFEDNWHLWAIAHYLDLCRKGEIKRLLITLPPRSLKSHIVSVCFPAFLLGHNPSTKIICASNSQILAEEFSNQNRLLMSEPWYESTFPNTILSPIKNTASDFSTTKMGKRIATSPGGTLTGRGGMYIIVDDINKAGDAASIANLESARNWFDNTLQSRLDNMYEGCIIGVQQRLHETDLAGHILKKEGWTHLNLPAIAQETQEIPIGDGKFHTFKEGDLLHSERYDAVILDRQKRDIGSFNFSAQYLQSPIPEQGNLIPIQSLQYFDNPPTKQEGDLVLNLWDTASGLKEHNDYSVGAIWLYRFNQYYLLNVVRRKMAYSTLRQEAKHQAALTEADLILIEKTGVGTALIDDLRKFTHFNIIESIPTQDKVTRMIPGTADIEAGKVILPSEAPWRAEFENECAAFPHGKHDDQVDCLSMFLAWARERQGKELSTRNLHLTLKALAQPTAPTTSPGLHTKEDIKNLFWPGI